MIREAGRAAVQAINHDPEPLRRARELRGWVEREYCREDAQWFEFAAAAGAGLSIYALFALAAQPWPVDAEIPLVDRAASRIRSIRPSKARSISNGSDC